MKFKAGDVVRVDRQDDDDPEAVEYHATTWRVIRTRETLSGTFLVSVADVQSNRPAHIFRQQDLELAAQL